MNEDAFLTWLYCEATYTFLVSSLKKLAWGLPWATFLGCCQATVLPLFSIPLCSPWSTSASFLPFSAPCQGICKPRKEQWRVEYWHHLQRVFAKTRVAGSWGVTWSFRMLVTFQGSEQGWEWGASLCLGGQAISSSFLCLFQEVLLHLVRCQGQPSASYHFGIYWTLLGPTLFL